MPTTLMRFVLRSCRWVCVGAWILCSGNSASAQSPDRLEVENAKRTFAQAEGDEAAERWADALERLQRVVAIRETAGVRFHIGNCHEHLGQLLAALGSFTRAQVLAQKNDVRDVLLLVQPRIRSLRGRVPTLTLRVAEPQRLRAMRVDEQPVALDHGDQQIQHDPGLARISVDLADGRRWTREVGLTEGSNETVLVCTQGGVWQQDSERPRTSALASPPSAAGCSASVPAKAWIAFGAGSALLAGGIFAYRHAGALSSESAEVCAHSIACDPARGSTVRRWDAIALGMWIGAAASIGSGLVWAISAHPTSQSAAFVVVQPTQLSVRAAF
jgi:hypothetical protein